MAGFMGKSSVRGIGMIFLQALRVCTVITLFATGAACWVLIIKVDKLKPFFVFQCISLFFTSIFCSLLVVSELALAQFIKVYLRRTWPVLSDHYGMGWLGGGMLIIGCNVLGALNRSDESSQRLDGPFSSLVLASGILSFVFGSLNIICSMIWCDTKEGITARDIRANGSLAQASAAYGKDYESGSNTSASLRDEKTKSKFVSMFWKKEENASPPTTARPEISRPYMSHPPTHDIERNAGVGSRASPIIPGVKRPDTALHPIHTRRSSKYSEADMSRF
ncbi:hypothetical protein ESCO_001399 [Escovopsis weberi]|uniref:DUF7598 domain-containing protein n=1 Tax=Escovopsis weberi TaxID=150374 RepID=A0A0M9VTG2_ESCWE|nr:hypothetical protein ESCO_001399 [Escovopsis weberi]